MKEDKTKEKILSAAKDVFSSKGYTRATTKEISNVAGVAEITIFRRFESKSNLFRETIINYLVDPMLDYSISYEQSSVKEKILNIIEERINTLRNNKDLFMSAICEARHNNEVKNMIQEIYLKVFEILSLSIKYEQKKPNDKETNNIAQTLLLTIVGGIIFESLGANKEFRDSNELLETIKFLIYKNDSI
ncbi:TetR/AcrR family transcriptional regulator [Schnuerera sp. xch1]|uniref:TetR/AcrR family transcriptional regulator n=1 Tax=Schnuerera sp. xch1 TaxID=2874283 RepID=UPI001CBC4859|nr:TetR/AcrR family transcriptional regulator [Schnuerera sp. xch1]MBZ2173997.1 TetR/AcrR family transcriptional regulator [Schnuerera sp. xch1]